jgi:hypothetical protein
MRPRDSEDGLPARWHGHPTRVPSRQRQDARATRRRCPIVECLEPRELPSTTPIPSPAVIQQSVNLLYGPGSSTPMTPTPHEVKRETIVGRWIGQYTVGPPRFSDRASTIHGWSKDGGSNASHIAKFQIALFPPADPSGTPTPGNPYANQVTGVAGLFAQNYLQSGGLIVFDLNGAVAAGASPSALPTHLNWTFDANGAGPFVAPAGFTQGTGTLDIKWIPDRHALPGTMGSGKMIVTIQGLINFNQINSPVSKVYN